MLSCSLASVGPVDAAPVAAGVAGAEVAEESPAGSTLATTTGAGGCLVGVVDGSFLLEALSDDAAAVDDLLRRKKLSPLFLLPVLAAFGVGGSGAPWALSLVGAEDTGAAGSLPPFTVGFSPA